MASVPGVPAPSVSQSSAQTPLQSISPPSEAFGLQTGGAALSEAGKVFGEQSDILAKHAEQFQAINNKQAADEKSIGFAQAVDQAQTEYHANNMGMAAYNNLAQFHSSVDALRTQYGQGLSPLAQVEYESTTRRYAQATLSNTATFAASQRKDAIVGTSNAKVQVAAAQAVASDDPTVMADSLATIGNEYAYQSKPEVLGLPPEVAEGKVREAVGAIYAGKTKIALDKGDYPAAEAIFNSHKDTMTEQQVVAVAGALKVGENAFQANAFRDAVVNGTPFSGTNVPAGKWDAGLASFKSDAAGTLSSLVGGPVVVTSAQRSPAKNAAVGGSPSSEHIPGNAWDFLAPGKTPSATAYTLAQAMTAKSIPFDQIEVDNSNGHVHVGFGPKNRNEVIDSAGHVLQQSVAQPAVTIPMPRLMPSTDPEQYIAQADAAIVASAHQVFKGNATLETQAITAAHAGVMLQGQQVRAGQQAAFDRLGSAIENGSIQDQPALATAYPGASGDLALINATPHYSIALQSALKSNANEVTPVREGNINSLNYLAANDPQSFIKQNLAAVDLPTNVRMSIQKQQDALKAKANKPVQVNTVVNQTLSAIEAQTTMRGLGFATTAGGAIDKTSPEFLHFAGALAAAVDLHSTGGKPPSQKEMNLIVSQVAAKAGKTSGFLGFGAKAPFDIPDDERTAIVAKYTSKGLTPTERDISETYNRARNRAP